MTATAFLFSTMIKTPLGHAQAIADEEELHLLAFRTRHRFNEQLLQLQKQLQIDELISVAEGSRDSLPLCQIRQELDDYFAKRLTRFETPFCLRGTEFQKAVWKELSRIPYGETCSYADIAAKLGRPTASRAVARANATNRLSIIVPCHRVIAADGSLSGYAGGVDRKQKLLELEADCS